MSEQTLPAPGGSAARPERGLSYFVRGGLLVTLIALAIGGLLFGWLIYAQQGPTPAQLLPGDVQLFVTLEPNLGDVLDLNQLRQAAREEFGLEDPAAAGAAIERLLLADFSEEVGPWIGSELSLVVRGADPAALAGPDAADRLLGEAELLVIAGSRNDPEALRFIDKHVAEREALGETFSRSELDGVTVYASQSGRLSPVAAFALIDHYLVFANRPEPLLAMAAADPDASGSLAAQPAFADFAGSLGAQQSGALYTDGSSAAQAARQALRQLLADL